MKKRISTVLSLMTLPLMVAALSGCGSYPNSQQAGAESTSPTRKNYTTGNSEGDSTSSDGATPTSSARNTGVAPYRYTVSGVGYDSHTFKVSAGHILKVRFTPGRQNRTQPGTSYTWQYSILGVFIEVGGNSHPTAPLKNGYPSGQPESSSVMDFSDSIGTGCVTTDTGCRKSVTITVNRPNNDDACINYSGYYCPYTRVPDGHPWNGTIEIETDDTNSL